MTETLTADVVVVGGGNAALAAAPIPETPAAHPRRLAPEE